MHTSTVSASRCLGTSICHASEAGSGISHILRGKSLLRRQEHTGDPNPATVKRNNLRPQTPTGFGFSWSILYNLIARATSFPAIFPSAASAAIAACAM